MRRIGTIEVLKRLREECLIPQYQLELDRAIYLLEEAEANHIKREWIGHEGTLHDYFWECPVCHRFSSHCFDFCPSCGAEINN